MSLLSKWLKKNNVDSFSDLNEEEKATYRLYEEALQGRKITDADVKDFFEQELKTAVNRLTEENLSYESDIFRKSEVRILNKIQAFLSMPALEQKMAEKQLEALTK